MAYKNINGTLEVSGAITQSGTMVATMDSLAPAYSNEATYAVGDLCNHGGKLYSCSTAIAVAEEWDIEHWTETDVSENIGGGGGVSNLIVPTTWSALKDLRDNSQLVPGMNYRITDYQCTTVTTNTSSANHQFDIIVTALTNDKLSESALACQSASDFVSKIYFTNSTVEVFRDQSGDGDFGGEHYFAYKMQSKDKYLYSKSIYEIPTKDNVYIFFDSNDTRMVSISEASYKRSLTEDGSLSSTQVLKYEGAYFVNCNLSAWKVWYCIDNDATRFDWADATNGKGVVYRLIDEYNNDVPYDFKNILFTKSDKYTNAYTFNWAYSSENYDASKNAQANPNLSNVNCSLNRIEAYFNTSGIKSLNFVVFYSSATSALFHSNSIRRNSYQSCFIASSVYDNVIGPGFSTNTISSSFTRNDIGPGFGGNTISFTGSNSGFSNNIIGSGFTGNTISSTASERYFSNNIIGSRFESNTLYGSFERNRIGASFDHNYVGTGFECNNVGPYVVRNYFGGYFAYNVIQGYLVYSKFIANPSGTSASSSMYIRWCTIDVGVQYIELYCSDTSATYNNYLQNVHIHSGVCGTSSSNKRITVPDRKLAYLTEYYATGSDRYEI